MATRSVPQIQHELHQLPSIHHIQYAISAEVFYSQHAHCQCRYVRGYAYFSVQPGPATGEVAAIVANVVGTVSRQWCNTKRTNSGQLREIFQNLP